jgi:hypothetical protein
MTQLKTIFILNLIDVVCDGDGMRSLMIFDCLYWSCLCFYEWRKVGMRGDYREQVVHDHDLLD